MIKRQVSRISVLSLAAFAIQSAWSPGSIAAPPSVGAPKTVTVLGRVLTLKDCKGGGIGQQGRAEYGLASETLSNWTLMFAVQFDPGAYAPTDAAAATVQNVKNRKASGQDPLANFAEFVSKDGKSAEVDFLVSMPKPQMFEHNVWKYFKSQGGISSYQIARRIYGTRSNQAKMNAFIKNIPANRSKIFQEIGRRDLPHWPN